MCELPMTPNPFFPPVPLNKYSPNNINVGKKCKADSPEKKFGRENNIKYIAYKKCTQNAESNVEDHNVVSTSQPSSVTATVCSKCAARELSFVLKVKLSSATNTVSFPAVSMGSMASVIPSSSITPFPFNPKLGICGSSCNSLPTPCPTSSRTTPMLCSLANASMA